MIKESLELRHIGKSFGAVRVLDDINFKLTSGKIYGLAGENGAGKSTTMKIINGAYIADEGEIVIDGETAHFTSPLSAQEAGIGMVYQELNMLPDLSVAENVFISRLSDRKSGYINWNSLHERTGELLKMLDLKLDTHTRLGELKVAHQQLVAIVRALSIECKVVILDEPTSALTEKDSAIVLDAVRRLKELGYIIIYISHKLQEMLTATDEIIVFRNGKKIGQYESKTLDEERLSELIAGRKLEAKFPKKRYPQGKELLRFDHVCVEGYLEDISFTLYEGDILGFATVGGAVYGICTLMPFLMYGNTFTNDPNMPYYMLNSFLMTLVALSLSFLIGTLVHSEEALSPVVNVVSLGMSFLCGVFVDLEILGKGVRTFAQFLPAYWYEVATGLLANNSSLSSAQQASLYTCYGMQVLFAAAILGVAMVISRLRQSA